MKTRLAFLLLAAALGTACFGTALAAQPRVQLFGPEPRESVALVVGEVSHVVVVDIDGLRRDTLYGLLAYRPEDIPNISYLVGYVSHDSLSDDYDFASAAGVNRATTMLPSVTVPSQLAILTGRWPKHHGFPANSWFSRRLARPIDFAVLLEGVLASSLSSQSESSNLLEAAAGQGFSAAVAMGATALKLDVRPPQLALSLDPAEFDEAMTTAVLRLVNRVGVPHILIVYYAGNDINSHSHGADAQEDYLSDVLDPQIGRLLNGDPDLPGLMDLDSELISNTLFVFCADHGHINVKGDDSHAIGTSDLNAALAGTGYTIGQNAAFAANGGAGLLYLRSRLTGLWTRPSAVLDVLPVARALSAAESSLGNYLDVMLVRVNGWGDGRAYRVFEPDSGRVRSLRAFFAEHGQDYPDALARVLGTDPEKLGDLVLFPNRNEGFDFAEGPGTVSDHGSLLDTESYVPLIFAGAGTVPKTIARGRNIDIAPTVADALGLWLAWRNADGRALPIGE